MLFLTAGASGPSLAGTADASWRVGLARVRITPEKPIRMAGYSSRNKPSEGVLAELYAKAMATEDAEGNRAVLITADLIGYRAAVAEMIRERIRKATGLKRAQILLSPSHTHTGPILGIEGRSSYSLPEEDRRRVGEYTQKVAEQLATLTAAALDDLQPARLAWGVGLAGFVMNRREFTDTGVTLGFNPRGYVDRSVPVLRVEASDGKPRALVFACACHNTTLTGEHYVLSGDYAGFAQAHVEQELPGVQAMFMIGCGGSANPYPRGSIEDVRNHGRSLGSEVCRVAGSELKPIRGPLRTVLEEAELPLAPVPSRERLEEMARGPSYIAFNARRMIEALDAGRPLPRVCAAPIAVWQFGDDLTLVGLPGEVVGEYVPLLETALGHRRLWIAGYCNDCFGYLPTAKVLAEGGYETRCLISEAGFFAPEVEGVVVAKVRQLARQAGRAPAVAPGWSAEEAAEGFVPIFDGKSLDGWIGLDGSTDSYYVRDGALICKATGNVHIFTRKEYADFILRMQIKMDPGGNNGVGIRTKRHESPHLHGMEIQVLDDAYYADGDPIELKDYQHHGSIYGVVPAKTGHLKPAGQWNDEEIVCDGRHVKVTLNGAVIVEADLDQVQPRDHQEHPGLKYHQGHISLHAHGNYGAEVFFRNLRVKELTGPVRQQGTPRPAARR